jgi:hypothetical protein
VQGRDSVWRKHYTLTDEVDPQWKQVMGDCNIKVTYALSPQANPFVDLLFSNIKMPPDYPDRFLDLEQAVKYFEHHFLWYNKEHFHAYIDYFLPEQFHNGLKVRIISCLKENLKRQRHKRKEMNHLFRNVVTNNTLNLMANVNQIVTCSLMIS